MPTEELNANEQIREQITDAVTGLSDLDGEPSQIEQAEAALANGDTELAKALYRTNAENKVAAGDAQHREAAESYRRFGALAYLNDTAAAREAYQNAIVAWPEDIQAWNEIGNLYIQTGQLDLAMEAYEKVVELADSTDEPQKWAAISHGNFGNVHRIRGDYEQAVPMYQKSLAINTELDYKKGIARDYSNLGIVHGIRGELGQAIELFEKSLAINTELGHKEGIAVNYNNLGIAHQKRGELDQAVELYEKSLAINTGLGRKSGMASNYNRLGIVHQKRGELDQAVELYEKSLAINTGLGRKSDMASNYNRLGIVHQERGELDQAIEIYEKLLAINTGLGRKADMANNYIHFGIVHQKRGEIDRARASWEHAIQLLQETGSSEAAKVQKLINNLE